MVHFKKIWDGSDTISLTGVAAGFFITTALLYLSMSFAAGLGYWSYRPLDSEVNQSFWTAVSAAWIVSVSIGSYIAVLAARSEGLSSGVLNALATWACSFFLFGGVAQRMSDPHLYTFDNFPDRIQFWHGFLADAMSLLTAIGAGILATVTKRLRIQINKKADNRVTSSAILNRLDPAKISEQPL